MKSVTPLKAIRRAIADPSRVTNGPMILELGPGGCSFRRPGRRVRLSVSWRDVYRLAEERQDERQRRERLRRDALDRHRHQLTIDDAAGGAR